MNKHKSKTERNGNKYKLQTDSKFLGSILILIGAVLLIFSLVRVPGVTTIHAYTFGMLFGRFAVILYAVIILNGLKMVLGKDRLFREIFFVNRFNVIFIFSATILVTLVWAHYYNNYDKFAFGATPWNAITEWWAHFTHDGNGRGALVNPWNPNDYLGGFYGAFLFAVTASVMTTLGAGILASILAVMSLSFIFYGNPFDLILAFFKLFIIKIHRRTPTPREKQMQVMDEQLTQAKEELVSKTQEMEKLATQTHKKLAVTPSGQIVAASEAQDVDFVPLVSAPQDVETVPLTKALDGNDLAKRIAFDMAKIEQELRKSPTVIEATGELPFDNPLSDWEMQVPVGYKISSEILTQPQSAVFDERLATEASGKSERLNQLFEEFRINARVIDNIIGPTLTKYIVDVGPGVNLKRIASIEDNIKMNLAATSVRMELPIPGRAAIGIECPNSTTRTVTFKEVFEKIDEPANSAMNLPAALGILIDGKPLIIDLSAAPHILVAGATGSGKSVGINSILISLIMRFSPFEVSLILVDPKMVEFTPYQDTQHLYRPIITDPQEAADALNDVVEEMEHRYRMMAQYRVRKFQEWNANAKKNKQRKWPFLVVVIDELADLMNVAKKLVEVSIQRITQKARAAGIHLIVATQRPSVDVVTGVIKANIPSRLAFAVTSAVDSKVILDAVGAERLLGYGDMLLSFYGSHIQRAQGAYLSNQEIEKVVSLVRGKGPYFQTPVKRVVSSPTSEPSKKPNSTTE